MRVAEIFTLVGGDNGSRGSYAEGDFGDGYQYGGYYGDNRFSYNNGYNDYDQFEEHPYGRYHFIF